jgi:Formate hydrogenlyase subunit 3/Multisubunit Na+/H+ antiporter, MnhD subunit
MSGFFDIAGTPANLAALPIIGPIVVALFCLLAPRPALWRRILATLAFAGLLVHAICVVAHNLEHGPLILRVGGWLAPYGIVLYADTLAGVMLALSSFTALSCALFGFAETPVRDENPLRIPLLLFLLAGINLSFVTGDLFNLFVAFEVMLLASYGLMTLEVGAKESRQALPYLTLNLVGSSLFLAVAGFAYSLFGTLNFAEIAVRADALVGDYRLTLLAVLMLLVFGLKAGLFPLYQWLPGSYSMMPSPMAAFYAGMLTKVGVYVLIRIFGTVMPAELTGIHSLIAWTAGLTMVIGVLGAVGQGRVQTILSYHIVSQIGFMALAIGLHSPFAFTAAIFYITHHIVVKAALFLVGGSVTRLNGTDDLSRTGGLWRAAPWLGIGFVLQAMSLAGLPPLSGFWGKFMIIQEGFTQGQWVLVTLSLVASILTLMSMLKIWLGAFWKPAPEDRPVVTTARTRAMSAVIVGMAAVSLCIGFGAEKFVRIAKHAATETLDRAGYVERVRGSNDTLYPNKTPGAAKENPKEITQ